MGRPLAQSAAQAVFQTLQTLGGAAENPLRAQFEAEALQRALQYLRQKKLVTCETSHRRRVNDKTEAHCRSGRPGRGGAAFCPVASGVRSRAGGGHGAACHAR